MSSTAIRARISELKEKRAEYVRRRSAVQGVQKMLNGQFDDDVSRAREQNERVTEYLEYGLKGDSLMVSQLCGQIDAVKEKQVWVDADLSGASADIDAEERRCASEISRLDSEISSLQAQLAAALLAEAEAAIAKDLAARQRDRGA